jgi:uncharacterized MAPEG superfamily protein
MSLAYWCIVVAAMLPYVMVGLTVIPSNSVASRWGKDYDNHDPRRALEKLVGWRRRAQNAQTNSFEAFPPFAAAVFMAQSTRGVTFAIDAWAAVFVALRALYVICYVADFPTARSTIWTLGCGSVLALFGIAAGVSY